MFVAAAAAAFLVLLKCFKSSQSHNQSHQDDDDSVQSDKQSTPPHAPTERQCQRHCLSYMKRRLRPTTYLSCILKIYIMHLCMQTVIFVFDKKYRSRIC